MNQKTWSNISIAKSSTVYDLFADVALRELLSSSQREALEAVPLDRAELKERYVLGDQDLSLIRRRRGAQNRLGLAVQLAFLRYPGARCYLTRPRLRSY